MAVAGANTAAAQSVPQAVERAIERYRVAEQPFRFDGRVEASQRAAVSTRIDGVVEAIHFKGGEIVEKGDLLISLDPTDAQLALQAVQADLLRAKARVTLAEQDIKRVIELMKRGNATLQRRQKAEAELALAKAELASVEVSVDRAEVDLSRTAIRAPIAGRVTRPRVVVGALIEAEESAPLAEVLEIDPVVVAYDVPYVERLIALEVEDLEHLEEMLPLVTLRLEIAGQIVLPQTSKPEHLTTELNDAGAITVRATFDNPRRLLRPGLKLQVISDLDEDAVETLLSK